MLSPIVVHKVLEAAMSTGADFADLFAEETYSSDLSMIDSKPSKALVGRLYGAGVRLFFGHEQIYVTTNDLSEAGLMKAALTAAKSKAGAGPRKVAPWDKTQFDSLHAYGTHPSAWDREKKFSYLVRMDRAARARSSMVVQVEPRLLEKSQNVLIANSDGLWVEDERNWVRAMVHVMLDDKGVKQESYTNEGTLGTSEFFETVNFEELAYKAVDRAALLIHADYAPAGEMPVIIDNDFGGVIFHEACGHGLETTSVAKNASVFCGKLGEMIAHECVTAIDDGTMANTWGSLNIDDEGLQTKRTVLIEKGVLKSYMVDRMGARKTGYEETGSGRRQSYKFAPTSRMRNTFIAPGKDKVEDMIRDIDYGLYAKSMGGGSVSPGTGDYNFGVTEAYLVRNGKIEKPVKGATLIGRGIDTLGKIVKVADNLKLAAGMCGSSSGHVPVTIGQPAILVSSMLVGGRVS